MKKQLKKCLSTLLTLVMLLSLLPTTALAATITPKTPAGSGTSADPYRIGTAAELYGFAEIVNGDDDYDYLDGNKDAYAILTADITVNENVLDADGKPSGTDFIPWKPIERLAGVLDGKGHTISGLYLYETEGMCCFIDEVWGVVRDLTVTDSYFGACYGSRPMREAGGICAVLDAAGTVWGCSFSGTVESDLGSGYPDYVGGIAGRSSGAIKECSVSGYISGKVKDCAYGVGGITGVCSGTIVNCHNSADIINRYTPAQDLLEEQNWCSTGGIAGTLHFGSSVTDCSNSGTITAYGFVGGIAGYMEEGSVQRCYNTGTIQERYFVDGADATEDTHCRLGGIVGFVYGSSYKSTIKNCYNTGSIRIRESILNKPGGYTFQGCGILGEWGSSAANLTLSYCHNYNDIVKTDHFWLFPISDWDGNFIQNCYYLASENWDAVENTQSYSRFLFSAGSVLKGLNVSGNTGIWEQGEEYPELIAPAEILPTKLEITTHPDKTDYTAGEDFDPTGMVVKMHYSDGSALPVVGYTVVNGDCLLNTMHSVTIRYTDRGVTRQTDEPIFVTGDNPAFKVTVNLQGSGGGTYEVGSQVTITARAVNNAQFVGWGGLADVKITMGSVTSRTVTFIMPAKDVTATPVYGEVKSIAVTKSPTKTVYYEGEDFDSTGMVVTAYIITILDNQKVALPITGYTVTNGTDLAEGQTSVTIRYQTGTGLGNNWSTTQPITVLPVPTVTVTNGSGGGKFIPGTEVTAVANAADDQIFWSWRGLPNDVEITEGSAFTPSVTFLMPEEDVTLEAILEPIELERPEGDGTEGNPFEIGTMGELYWFQNFVNGAITADDITVTPTAACAKVVQDITVNADLLDSDGVPAQTFGLAKWTPIGMDTPYTGTFDGQNHTISGIYYDPQSAVSSPYVGFFGTLGAGSTVRNLTLEDSYFCAPTEMENAYTGGIVGQVPLGSTVENCHFDGTVTTPNKGNSGYLLGGIAGICAATIRDCTSKGLITGYFTYGGGIVGQVVSDTTGSGQIIGCRNEADVLGLRPYEDTVADAAGGIAGRLNDGIIRDCSNAGRIDAGDYQGGIAGYADGTNNALATISRCWNKGETIAGIVQAVYRNVHVKNCYNVGTVSYGIVGNCIGSTNSLSYCHNVGETSDSPILPKTSSGSIEVASCFYLADSETDEIDGTSAKSATLFGPKFEAVCQMLNSGDNAGNWKQGDDYPVLAEFYPVTVNGGTGSGEYGEGASVTIFAEVPDGKLFKGWTGLDGLTITEGSESTETVTFIMPAKAVELTAEYMDAPVFLWGGIHVSDSSASVWVTVENLTPGTEAILIVAQYSGDQMTDAHVSTVTANDTFTLDGFTHTANCTYQAFLVDAESCAPLCSPAPLIGNQQ